MRFALIGHLARDITPSGYALGGGVIYAGLTAQHLGAEATLVTSAHPDDVRHPALAGLRIHNLNSAHTTIFHNTYHAGIRSQHLLAVANPIGAIDLPAQALDSEIMLLTPLAQEVDPNIASHAKGMVAAAPQGWLRRWDDQGRVFPTPSPDFAHILPRLDAVLLSDSDLSGNLDLLKTIVQNVPYVVVTLASAGCDLYLHGKCHRIAPRPAFETDPTGAGDIFAAAFLIRLYETGDAVQAAYFANVTASMSVEARGITGIPTRSLVEAYVQEHPFA